jgi:hypothetical protein
MKWTLTVYFLLLLSSLNLKADNKEYPIAKSIDAIETLEDDTVTHIIAGDKVKILGEQGWAYVIEFEGKKFYVSKKYLDLAIVEEIVGILKYVPKPDDKLKVCPIPPKKPAAPETDTQPKIKIVTKDTVPLDIILRTEWDPNGRAGFKGSPAPMLKKKADKVGLVVLHHTSDNGGPEKIENGHKQRGMKDIAYHFIIPKEKADKGDVYQARDRKYQGSHAKGANDLSIGIALIGNFQPFDARFNPYGTKDGDKPTAFQEESLKKLLKFLGGKYPSLKTLKGHREVGITKTDCPGNNAMYLTKFQL